MTKAKPRKVIEKSTEASIIQYLLQLANLLKQGGDLQCQSLGITTQQWLILLHLASDPNMPFFHGKQKNGNPVRASQLAESFNVSRANITNLLNVLQDKGLVSQREVHVDRRKKHFELTEDGKAVLERLEPVRRAGNARLFSSFTPDEKDRFVSYLQRCFQHMSHLLK